MVRPNAYTSDIEVRGFDRTASASSASSHTKSSGAIQPAFAGRAIYLFVSAIVALIPVSTMRACPASVMRMFDCRQLKLYKEVVQMPYPANVSVYDAIIV